MEIISRRKIEQKPSVKFTNSQQVAAKELIEFFNNPYEDKKRIMGLIGCPGVGKSFLVKYLISNCKLPDSCIKITSPTHKACRVLEYATGKKAQTIQSAFGFRLNMKLEDFDYKNPAFRPISSPKLENIEILIIDEASMLNASLVGYINKICGEHCIKILYVGDASQLAPVNEKRSTAFLSCVKVYELKEIVRQEENNPIIELLNIIREDINKNTLNSLSFLATLKTPIYNEKGEGFSVVNERTFTNIIKEKFNDEEYTKNIDKYKIIAYTNLKVSKWNNFIRNEIILDSDKNIITKNDLIMSYETIVDDFNSPIITNSEEYIINDIVSYVDPKYKFKGFLIKFQLVNGGIITKPLFIIDHRDKFTIMSYIKTMNELIDSARRASGATRASKWKAFYDFKKNYLLATNIKKEDTILYSRDLDYAFAITSHRAQGSTYDNVFIDLNDIAFTSTGIFYADKEDMLRRLYVACSRARKEIVISYGK